MNRLKSIPVDDYTTPSPFFVNIDSTLQDIIDVMEKNSIRHLPVVLDNKPVGIISDRDIKLVGCLPNIEDIRAKDIMTEDPYTVSPDTPLEDVVFMMSKNKIGSAIVLEQNGSISGLFTSTDALNALIEVLRGVA